MKQETIYYNERIGSFRLDLDNLTFVDELEWRLVDIATSEVTQPFCEYMNYENAVARRISKEIFTFNEIRKLWELYVWGVRCGEKITKESLTKKKN